MTIQYAFSFDLYGQGERLDNIVVHAEGAAEAWRMVVELMEDDLVDRIELVGSKAILGSADER